MNHDVNDDLIIRYLLGGDSSGADVELCEDDTLGIEKLFLTDADFFEHMLAVEDELVQSFANGELTADERTRFEQKYSRNAGIQARVRFFRNLGSWAGKDDHK